MRESLPLQVVGLLLPNQTLASTVFWQVTLWEGRDVGRGGLSSAPLGTGCAWMQPGKGLEGAGNKSWLPFSSHTFLCCGEEEEEQGSTKNQLFGAFLSRWKSSFHGPKLTHLPWGAKELGFSLRLLERQHQGRAGGGGIPGNLCSQQFWEEVCMAKPRALRSACHRNSGGKLSVCREVLV